MTQAIPDGFQKVATLDQTPQGQARIFRVGERSIALCNLNGEIYAIDNSCSHDDGPLGDGVLCGREIECPRHGARFDVITGEATAMPAAVGVQTYPTRVVGQDILVRLD